MNAVPLWAWALLVLAVGSWYIAVLWLARQLEGGGVDD